MAVVYLAILIRFEFGENLRSIGIVVEQFIESLDAFLAFHSSIVLSIEERTAGKSIGRRSSMLGRLLRLHTGARLRTHRLANSFNRRDGLRSGLRSFDSYSFALGAIYQMNTIVFLHRGLTLRFGKFHILIEGDDILLRLLCFLLYRVRFDRSFLYGERINYWRLRIHRGNGGVDRRNQIGSFHQGLTGITFGFITVAALCGVRFLLFISGSDEGDTDLLAQRIVKTGTEDNVGSIATSLDSNIVSHLVHLVHSNLVFLAGREIEKYVLGSRDVVVVEEDRGGSLFHSLTGTVLTFAFANAHEGSATFLHNGIDITEVDIDIGIEGDDFGNTLHCGEEHIIGHRESIGHDKIAIGTEFLIADNQDGIGIFAQFGNALVGLLDAAIAFEKEWGGHNCHNQNLTGIVIIVGLKFNIFGNAGDNRSCTGTCSTTHTGSKENHLGVGSKESFNLLFLLLGCFTRFCGTTTNSQTFVSKN